MNSVDSYHIVSLQNELGLRVRRNPGYSIRAFARDLNLSASSVSLLLKGKRGLSASRAREVSLKIEHSKEQAEAFRLSVASHHARSKKDRIKAQLRFQKVLESRKATGIIRDSNLELIQNWHCLAILELIELEECEHTPEWISKKLGIKLHVVRRALNTLQKLSQIIFANGKYKAVLQEHTTDFDIPSSSIKRFHSEVLDKAKESLFCLNVDEREFINMTLAFPENEMANAKETIRRFQKYFAEKYYSQNKKKNSVFQLSVQFFRLDKKESYL